MAGGADSGQAAAVPQPAHGRAVLELHLVELQQLLNSMDPAPFRERDLDSKATDYIVDRGALRRPLEIFLYDWWPLRAQAKLYDRLGRMQVGVA